MKTLVPLLLFLAFTGCNHSTPNASSGETVRSVERPAAVAERDVDAAYLNDWTDINQQYRFTAQSEARKLVMPAQYRNADLGYFDEPQMLAQFSAKALATMAEDDAGFSYTADLDRNGRPETYRVGYWSNPIDGHERYGTFISVFEGDKQRGVTFDTHDQWRFLSWHDLDEPGGVLAAASCNCPGSKVRYRHGHLTVGPFAQPDRYGKY